MSSLEPSGPCAIAGTGSRRREPRKARVGPWATLLLTLAAQVCPGNRAAAGVFHLVPSMDVREEYTNNVFFTSRERKSTGITTVSPGLELADRTEILDASLSGRLGWVAYSADSSLDSLDLFQNGNFRYRLTPRLGVSAGAGYTRDSRHDRDLRATGIVDLGGSDKVIRRSQAYSLGGTYALTEATTTAVSCSFNKDDYSAARFVGTTSRNGTLTIDHDMARWMKNTRANVSVGYTAFLFTGGKDENYTATAGMNRALDEKWSVNADLGGRHTRSRIDSPPEQSYSSSGLVGHLAVGYAGELAWGSLTYGRELSTASGRAGAALRDSFVLSLAKAITEKFSGTFYAGAYRNTTDRGRFSPQQLDEKTLEVNPGVLYRFTKDLSLSAGYSYVRVRSSTPADSVTVDRNSLFVQCTGRYDVFE